MSAYSIRDLFLRTIAETIEDYLAQKEEVKKELINFIRTYKGKQLTQKILDEEAGALVDLVLITRGIDNEDINHRH